METTNYMPVKSAELITGITVGLGFVAVLGAFISQIVSLL